MNNETIEIPLVKATYEELQQVICELQVERYEKDKEIERLRNEIKKISEQHIYTLDKLIETQTRIEKTIEYIKSNYIDNPIEFKKDLLNMLEVMNNEKMRMV